MDIDVVKAISSSYPQITCGKLYSIERVLASGFIKLLGIEQPVPSTAVEYVPAPETPVTNRFIRKRYRLVEEIVVAENVVGTTELKDLMIIDSSVVEEYSKAGAEVGNVSEWIQRNLGI